MEHSTTKTNRIPYMDVIRTIAIVMVVLVHACNFTFSYDVGTMTSLGVGTRLIATIAFALGRLGVPLFLFLTGALLLPRDYEGEKPFRFWKRNLLPIVIAWEVWICIYAVFLSVYNQELFSLEKLVKSLLFFEDLPLVHVWYMPVLIGVYLFLPLVAILLKKIPRKVIFFLLAIIYISYFVLAGFTIILRFWGKGGVSTQLDLGFGGGAYGFYLILGYLCSQMSPNRLKKWQDIVGFVLCMGIAIVCQVCMYSRGAVYNIWYTFPLLPFAAVFLYDFIRKVTSEKRNFICERISVCSFGVFLVHVPVQMILAKYITIFSEQLINIVFLWIIGFVISYVLIELLQKIPFIGKLIFLGKRP